MRVCEWCPGELPKRARVDARFCSDRCRQASCRARRRAPKSAVLPRALTRLPRWVRRAHNKVPLNAANGTPARANNPQTWTTYEIARDSRVGVGLGIVLNGDGIVCVDLDHVISADGTLSAAAERWLATLSPTYIEVSPSGDGLHVWGRGLVLTSRKIRAPGITGEVIGARKYVTITGRRWGASPLTLADISGPAGALVY